MKEWFQKFLKLFENDITDEIRERVTNPFFVSLALSWFAWNWRLVFIFFNLHPEDPLEEKIFRIKRQLIETPWCNLYIWPIVTALAAVLVLGLTNQGSLAISIFFRRRFRPLIFKKIGYKDIVDLETHDKIKKRLYNLQEAYTSLESRSSNNSEVVTTLKKERDDAKDKVLELENDVFELKNSGRKHTLEGLFDGTWTCEFIMPEGKAGEERVEIQNGNKYLIEGRYTFDLDMIEVVGDIIKYRKVDINDERRSCVGVLKIIDANEYRGIEEKNTIISYKKHGTHSMELKFTPRYEPNEIQPSGKSRMVFKIKNNTNTHLEVISYQFYCIFERMRIGEYPKHDFKQEINGGSEFKHEFNQVEPLKEYFNNSTKPGIYDSEIHLEYRLNSTTEVRKCVSSARLVVTDGIVIYAARYGAGASTNDVTEKIKDLVSKGKFEIEVNNTLFGDPKPGVQKTLVIDYSINGQKRSLSGPEGTKLKIE